jgi:hypothetical protein
VTGLSTVSYNNVNRCGDKSVRAPGKPRVADHGEAWQELVCIRMGLINQNACWAIHGIVFGTVCAKTVDTKAEIERKLHGK